MLSASGGTSGYSVIMVDMQAFLDASATTEDPHLLASTPFDGAIIKTLPLDTPSSPSLVKTMAVRATAKSPQKPYGTTRITH